MFGFFKKLKKVLFTRDMPVYEAYVDDVVVNVNNTTTITTATTKCGPDCDCTCGMNTNYDAEDLWVDIPASNTQFEFTEAGVKAKE